MTPLAHSTVLPENFGSSTQAGEQPLPSPLLIVPPIPILANTSNQVLPVLPIESTPSSEPVNPVNSGNMAGLPSTEAEGITDGTIAKTFKLPIVVMRSIERTVEELNKVTPGNTTHNYGVNLLSKHKELMAISTAYNGLLEKIEESNRTILHLQQESANKTQQIQVMATLLEQAKLPKVTPPPTPQPEPVTPPTDDAWRLRFLDIQHKLEKALEAHAIDKRAAEPLYSLFKVLPELLEQLYLEAERNSWNSAAYYSQFFQELLAPYLATN
ncbi:hypothetical protein GO755_33575 [Spirosoma sp. HMF4905]|uniref:Uncharacterized protein n=1 Tax=Spirosoma arboris TaxID=2682092 RepID=A0A7K1SMI8_9BACT|nr:hypothetical protein [Spirosoma arboris]MVM35007.1 hypothetical protein [Spirosoma arboris]